MEGLVEIQQAQSSASLNTVGSVNSGSTLSLRKMFGSMTLMKKPRSRYDTLGVSDTESVRSFSSTKSGRSTTTNRLSRKNSRMSNISTTKSESAARVPKSGKLNNSVDKLSNPKDEREAAKIKYSKSKTYHELCWSQAYAFGGR